jgi:hypothetical protein
MSTVDFKVKAGANVTGNLTAGNAAATTYTGTTVNVTGQLISTVATSTPPLVVTSTTVVANLNVAQANVASYESITTGTTGNYYLTMANATTGNIAVVANSAILANLTSGTLYATKFSGDGGLLSNMGAAATNVISNGTSNVTIATSGGNVTVGVAGNANIMQVTGTGAVVATDTSYATNRLRNLKIMSSVPVAGDFLGNGDIIFVYVP